MHQLVGQLTRVGEQQQAFGVQVKTTDRHPLAVVQARQTTEHRGATLRIIVCDDFARGLVIGQDAGSGRRNAYLDRATGDLDAVAKGDALTDVSHLVVHLDAAVFDHLLDVAARADTGLGQHLLQLGGIGLGQQHALVDATFFGSGFFGLFTLFVKVTRQELGEHLGGLLGGDDGTARTHRSPALFHRFGRGFITLASDCLWATLFALRTVSARPAAITTVTSVTAIATPTLTAGCAFAFRRGGHRRALGLLTFLRHAHGRSDHRNVLRCDHRVNHGRGCDIAHCFDGLLARGALGLGGRRHIGTRLCGLRRLRRCDHGIVRRSLGDFLAGRTLGLGLRCGLADFSGRRRDRLDGLGRLGATHAFGLDHLFGDQGLFLRILHGHVFGGHDAVGKEATSGPGDSDASGDVMDAPTASVCASAMGSAEAVSWGAGAASDSDSRMDACSTLGPASSEGASAPTSSRPGNRPWLTGRPSRVGNWDRDASPRSSRK